MLIHTARMADLLAALLGIAFIAALLWIAGLRALGHPQSVPRASLRMFATLALAALLVVASVYFLSRARTFQVAGELVNRVETEERLVALTFDDGPSPEHADEVLRLLDAHDAKATFYVTGREAEQNPLLVSRMVADGHELGNHTYSHLRLVGVPSTQLAEEIEDTDSAIRAAGFTGDITFRPPGCKRLLAAPLYLMQTGRTTVTWDVEPDSIDGVLDDSDAIVAHTMERVRPGSIVLLHVFGDSRQPSRDALARLLDELDAEGYEFVTVAELLERRTL